MAAVLKQAGNPELIQFHQFYLMPNLTKKLIVDD